MNNNNSTCQLEFDERWVHRRLGQGGSVTPFIILGRNSSFWSPTLKFPCIQQFYRLIWSNRGAYLLAVSVMVTHMESWYFIIITREETSSSCHLFKANGDITPILWLWEAVPRGGGPSDTMFSGDPRPPALCQPRSHSCVVTLLSSKNFLLQNHTHLKNSFCWFDSYDLWSIFPLQTCGITGLHSELKMKQ